MMLFEIWLYSSMAAMVLTWLAAEVNPKAALHSSTGFPLKPYAVAVTCCFPILHWFISLAMIINILRRPK